MKKFFVTMLLVLLTAPSFAQIGGGGFSIDEDNVYYGIRFGITSASFSGDWDSDSRIGMTLAGIVGLRVSQSAPLFLESGLYYTERGGKLKVAGLEGTTSYNNLEVPLLIKYGIDTNAGFSILPYLGPTFGYAIKTDELTRANMGFKLGCGAEFNQLYVELGRHLGVTSIGKNDVSIRSNAWYLNVGIHF